MEGQSAPSLHIYVNSLSSEGAWSDREPGVPPAVRGRGLGLGADQGVAGCQ